MTTTVDKGVNSNRLVIILNERLNELKRGGFERSSYEEKHGLELAPRESICNASRVNTLLPSYHD